MKIADVFFRALLDDSTLQVDAAKTGDKMGQTLGQRTSMALKGALKTSVLTGFAGVAAIASKGALQLEEIQAKFQAATGATAEEAQAAGKAINELAGHNLQSLGDVGDAFIEVRKQMGLTGDEATSITDLMLKFAEATGQNAATAVDKIDHVQDAWNLTSADTQKLLDELIAGTQKYGGSVAENETALANIAPQLKALNVSWQEGIGLLNLFAASGIDAGSTMRALNTAVKNLKPGQSLDDLVKQISSIEDPAKRAQAAIKIFGARGGVTLANALHPGITSLHDFEVSAKDAAGATQRASDAIEGTFGNRIRLAIKGVGAEIIGVGHDFGPVLTGLAAVASLGGALGFDKVISKALNAIGASSAIKGAATAAGALIGTIFTTALKVAEKIAGAVTSGLANIGGRVAIKLAATQAGATVGAIFASAMKMSEQIGGAITSALLAIPGAQSVVAAATAAGLSIGGLLAAAIVGVPILLPIVLIPKVGAGPDVTGKDISKQGADIFDRIRSGSLVPVAVQAGEVTGDGFVKGVADAIADGRQMATKPIEKYGDEMIARGKQAIPGATAAIGGLLLTVIKGTNPAIIAEMHHQANLAMGAYSQAIIDARDTVQNAYTSLLDALKHQESPTKERAKLLGELVSKQLIQGLHSGDPAVRAQAVYTKQLIIDRLTALGANVKNIGSKGMAELRAGMKSKDADIRKAATDIYHRALHGSGSNGPADVGKGAYNYGKTLATNLIDGIRDQFAAARLAAETLAGIIANNLKGKSPTKEGPWSEAGGSEGWGRIFGINLARGIAGTADDARRAAEMIAVAGSPRLRAPSLASFASPGAVSAGMAGTTGAPSVLAGGIGELHVHLHDVGSDVSPERATRFGEQVAREMAHSFRLQGARKGIHPAVP